MSARYLAVLLSLALLGGCAAPKTIDYAAFKQSRPKSILVLPPINESPEIQASYSLVSQVTYPLAEAGYYVLPMIFRLYHRPSCRKSLARTLGFTSPSLSTARATC